jgi:hypothetical protein
VTTPGNDKVLWLPYRGAPQTVGLLRRAAMDAQRDFVVRRLVEDVCSGLDSKDYVSEYQALYHTVLSRCRYMRDPRTVELVRSPARISAEILRGGRPSLDCDDMSGLLAAWFLACGGSTRFATVAFRNAFFNGRRQYSHVFPQALDPRTGQWIVFDPVAAEKTPEMLDRVVAAEVWSVA